MCALVGNKVFDLPKFLHSFCGQRVSFSKLWDDYLRTRARARVCLCVKEKFRDFCSSPNIMKVIMSQKMRTAHLVRTGGEIKFIKVLGGKIGKKTICKTVE